jgi:hypothetical protein
LTAYVNLIEVLGASDSSFGRRRYVFLSADRYDDYFDWCFVRKYASPEPTHGVWSPQQQMHVVATLWGTSVFAEGTETLMGGTPESILSSQVSADIAGMFSSAGDSGWNYWGTSTQPSAVYSTVHDCDRDYSFDVFFYKGHSYDGTCGVPGCTFHHYAVYDNEGYNDAIWDYQVHGQMSSYSHKLVVLWSCGTAWSNATGDFNGGHSWGWEASFMGTNALNSDGYANPDGTTRCFIGFDNFSIWYRTSTNYQNYNYSDFVRDFFSYALQPGFTIIDALNAATSATHSAQSFVNCPLYYGYNMVDPRNGANVTRWMRIRGDGNLKLPR